MKSIIEKSILFPLFIYSLCLSCSPKGFEAISKKMDRNKDACLAKVFETMPHKLRMHLYDEKKLDFLNMQTDTVYFVHTSGYLGDYWARIWNHKSSYTYHYKSGFFDTDNIRIFKPELIELVSKWDIRKLEQIDQESIWRMHNQRLSIFQIIINKQRANIRCHKFDKFPFYKKEDFGKLLSK